MLSFLYPSLLPAIKEMPIGILPIILVEKEHPILVVKAPKEYILTAKVNASFKIYLVPVTINNQKTVGLITAFFDDEDEPLVIKTPLFADDFSKTLFKILQSSQLSVYLFDELSREHFVFSARITVPKEATQQIETTLLLKFSLPTARLMIDRIDKIFGLRTSMDDAGAITILLDQSLYGDGLFIQDLRPEHHSYYGSRGFSHTVIEREEPGSYQEEDIVQCLLYVFPHKQIYLNPKRIYDHEEICDILLITEKYLLIIQAKDSPNLERIIKQKLLRKRNNVMNSLKKAINQTKGAVLYSQRNTKYLEFQVDDQKYNINTNGLITKTLIIVKELFDDQFGEYSQQLLGFVRDKQVPCIALDYPEFYSYCVNLRDEKEFFNAYDRVMDYAIKEGEYPRLRFGLM
ncbi:hypothetical protein [uncultured Thiothrix sp.]|uniref:hypothetical protein n=1 Tax=uncultured Thiothrix sp. TaxID=223185 RepID=UPI0026242A8E|nr:hypothetical protein [uncultured Thiothrix sp.]